MANKYKAKKEDKTTAAAAAEGQVLYVYMDA